MQENSLLQRLDGLKSRFDEVSLLITDPNVIKDQKRYVRLNKEYSDLEKILNTRTEYRESLDAIKEAKELIETEKDSDMKGYAKEILDENTKKLPILEEKIKVLLIPSDPEDDKNAIMEIRGGSGGDEAAIFAGDLFRMYSRYCEKKKWKVNVTSFTEGSSGGYKEIIFTVSGTKVYGTLKYESGVHRVQRVPQTETQGRIQTSAASVAVFPEAEEFDIDLNENDIRVDIFNASGHGGQSVNTTYSAIRLVHIPTGITVQCQDEKSQIRNKAKAMVELRSRIYKIEHQKYLDKISVHRKSMVSTGDRSAKVRTYHFPQGRVTDHRINYTIHSLPSFIDGDIQDMIDKLTIAENSERLKENELK